MFASTFQGCCSAAVASEPYPTARLIGFGFANGLRIPFRVAHVRSVWVGPWGWLPAFPTPPAGAGGVAELRLRPRPHAPVLPFVSAPTELIAGDGFRGGRVDLHAVPTAAAGPVAASCARGHGAPAAAHVAVSRGHGGRRVVPPRGSGSGRWAAGEDAEAPRQGGGTGGRRVAELR